MENTEGNGGPQVDCFDERESPGMKRELKEKNISTDVTDGCPQADGGGERELFAHCLLIAELIKLKQVSEIIRKLKKIILV